MFCWILAWFGFVIFWRPFPCPPSRPDRNFPKKKTAISASFPQFSHNFFPQFPAISAIFHNFFGSSDRNYPPALHIFLFCPLFPSISFFLRLSHSSMEEQTQSLFQTDRCIKCNCEEAGQNYRPSRAQIPSPNAPNE